MMLTPVPVKTASNAVVNLASPRAAAWRETMVAILYGTLRGRVDRCKREDDASTPHLQVRVLDETGAAVAYRCQRRVRRRFRRPLLVVGPLAAHPILDGLDTLATSTPRPAKRLFARYDETASVAWYTSICRSHDVTALAAPRSGGPLAQAAQFPALPRVAFAPK
jgi:hypothetical protein